MADESIDESLRTCIRLMHGVMFNNWTGEDITTEERWEYRVVYDPNGVVVGAVHGLSLTISDDERLPAHYSMGRGPTLLAAVANWRARLAKGAQKKMAEHEAFRRYVEERGLLR